MTKNVKRTFAYIKHNWLSVYVHALIVSIIFTIFVNPTSSFDYIVTEISNFKFENMLEIFVKINDGSKWGNWQYVITFFSIAVVSLIVFSSFIGQIQNKMRYGQPLYHGIKGIFKRTNEFLFATLRALITVAIAMEFFAVLMSLVLYFAVSVIHSTVAKIVVVLFFAVLLVTGYMYGLAWLSCVLPNMTMRNAGLFSSMKSSANMVKDKVNGVFLDFGLPLLLFYIPILTISGFDIVYNHVVLTIIRYVVNFAFYMFSFTYYIIYMYCLFFDLNEIEREDINEHSKWRI